MQFDQAEYAEEEAASGPVCGFCNRGIAGEYFEVNGLLLCGKCRQAVGDALTSGSGIARFLRAGVYGFGAAVAGFAIYFGILKITGYQIGLISIVVGLMVGAAVRKGSRNRGGWLYQLLAMFLVYTAIVASYGAVYVPKMIAEITQKNAEEAAAKEAAPGPKVAKADAKPPTTREFFGILGQLGLLLILMVGFLYALPVLVGFQAPMGLLIIGFALWEAWKMNRKVPIVFNGPYRVGDGGQGELPAHA